LLTALGCGDNLDVSGKKNVSDSELLSIILNNQNFQSFLKARQFENSKIGENVDRLNTRDKAEFKRIMSKYESFTDFHKNSSTEEMQFMSALTKKGNTSSMYLSRLFQDLSSYQFDVQNVTQAIRENLTIATETVKFARDCEEVEVEVYVKVLNQKYWGGMSIEEADTWATIASSWAYYGCVKGQQ
jgi:hypothetical protein